VLRKALLRPGAVGRIAGGSLLVAAAGALVLVLASPAGAHALLERSDPLDGARLDEPPQAVRLEFTEPPELALSAIQVLDRSGTEVQEDTEAVPGEPMVLRAALPELEQGVYTVVWRVVSRVDGHPTAGTFAFGVGVSPLQVAGPTVAEEPLTPEPSPVEMAGRWGLFVGLGLLVGASWVGALAFPRPPRAVHRLALASTVVAAAGLVALAAAQRAAAGVAFGELVGTDVGWALLWRAVGVLVAAALMVTALNERLRRPALAAAGVAAAAVIYVHVDAGHAAAEGPFRMGQVLAQWAHFAAGGVWLGGLAALLLGVRGAPDETKASAVRRFSAVAAFALAVVALTGVVRAVDEVGAWGALFSTGYGQLVIVKAGLLLLLAILGGVNRYRNVRLAGRNLRGLRSVSRAELTLGAGVVAAAAILATLVPPESVPVQAAQPAAIVVSGSDFATSVRARLEVDPGLPGPNRFRVRLTDYDTGDPVDADRVQLRFSYALGGTLQESTLGLEGEGDGVYQAVGPNLAVGGPWEVSALVQRGGDATEVPLQVATLCETTDIPGGPLGSTVHVVEYPDGSSVEGYIIPSGERRELHFTFLARQGEELRVQGSPTFVASREGEEPVLLQTGRFGPGHFFSRLDLAPGRWRFDASATGQGRSLSGCFEEEL
jgi:copper transport protein